jgi:SulP family sulfate permease
MHSPLASYSTLRGDIAGGFASAVVTLPQVMAYGVIAFAPLGVDFSGSAAALGIYAAVLAGFVASLFGSPAIQITGPKIPLTLLIAALVAQLLAHPATHGLPVEMHVPLVLAAVSISVMIGGLFQIVLGASGIGAVAKYVPYPVVGGFMNGVAVLLILKQIPPLLGLDGGLPVHELIAGMPGVKLSAVFVGVGTVAATWLGKRFLPWVPAYPMGLVAGLAIHHGLERLGGIADAGPLLGALEFRWPEAVDVGSLGLVATSAELMPLLVVTGLAIGLIGSLESLFSSVVSDNLTGQRSRSNRELVAQGLGNLANSLIAALPAAGSTPRVRANFQAGGRQRLSGMLCAVFVLLLFKTLGPILDFIPAAAVAGMLTALGIELIDGWTVGLVQKLRAGTRHRSTVLLDLIVAAIVAVITIGFNLVVAIGAGIAIASALFIARTGRSVVRRRYDGRAVRSRKMRSPEQERRLEASSAQVAVFELQGPIFFGSVDNLIDELSHGVSAMRYVILDMERVSDIDSTGTRLFPQLKALLDKHDVTLLVSNLPEAPPLWQFLDLMGVVDALGRDRFFATTDAALEWAEEKLLSDGGHAPEGTVLHLGETAIAEGMTDAEIRALAACMSRRSYRAGQQIFGEGDRQTDMLVVLSGAITIRQQTTAKGASKRVFTYGPGGLIGELALLDGRPRSASAWADVDSTLLSLSPDAYEALKESNPALGLKLLGNVARVVSGKLRRASNELAALENS